MDKPQFRQWEIYEYSLNQLFDRQDHNYLSRSKILKKLKSKSNVKPEEKLAEGNVEAMPEEAKSENTIWNWVLLDSSNELPKEGTGFKRTTDEDIEQKGKGVIKRNRLKSTPEKLRHLGHESNAEDTEE